MNVFDLMEEQGFMLKQLGGEFHSSCPDPGCGGKDRFCVWPKQGLSGRYWCRQCEKKGDAIQFCRDFLKLSFAEACTKVGVSVPSLNKFNIEKKPEFVPKQSEEPALLWLERAHKFVDVCHKALLCDKEAIKRLKMRLFNLDTIRKYKLGWNASNIFDLRNRWGLPDEFKKDKLRSLWLPRGLVIPVFQEKTLPQKIKIRRAEWALEDKLPKYVEVVGSQKQFAIFGDPKLPIVLVEAEIDAMLLQQEAASLCCSVALGGAGKKPDQHIHKILNKAKRILFSLDFDEAGKKAFLFWRKAYPKILPWPTPIEKSPEDAFKMGVNLAEWIEAGLKGL